MNKATCLLLTVITGLGLAGCNATQHHGTPTLTEVWSIETGVKAPESAYYDASSRILFLSQIGEGGGTGKDGDGWISKLTLDGKMVQDKWATGFNAPKGLRSHGSTLWVADIDQIISIDINTGKAIKKFPVAGAKFLNDVACGPDGTVYVSDMIAGRIHQIKDGKLSVLVEGDQIEHPNGLLVHDGRLIIGGWGLNIQDDFSTKPAGRLLAMDLKTKKISAITPTPTGNLDGVEVDGHGGYIVTDWIAGKVFHISSKGAATVLITLPKGTADHAFITSKHLLILPKMLENKLTAYKLSY